MRFSIKRRKYLHASGAALGLALAGCTSSSPRGEGKARTETGTEKIDDWQYEPTATEVLQTVTGTPTETETVDDWQHELTTTPVTGMTTVLQEAPGGIGVSAVTGAANAATGAPLGFAVGGASDIETYRDSIHEGYLPVPTDLSYEGLFYEYYFETGQQQPCQRLFCPSYATAVTADPFSGEAERYLTVGLNSGLQAEQFERKNLNLVVVLDISGSMDAPFDEYYYDRFGERQRVDEPSERPKIDVATDSVAALTEQLRDEDRFGMVVFNDRAAVAKPIRAVGATDMSAIRGHIRELRASGGTDISAGIGAATGMLAEYAKEDPDEYETRMIVLTDAMPNLGTINEGGLGRLLEANAKRRTYTTFVGVGIDFNTELVDAITTVRGANYYTVRSADQFRRQLDDEFEYMVTPLVFDLQVELDSDDYDIARVYGTDTNESSGTVLRINTLFPSPRREEQTRGGVILVKLRQRSNSEDPTLTLKATWENRQGVRDRSTRRVRFPARSPESFDNSGIRKAVLLARYADLTKNWMLSEHEGGEQDGNAREAGIALAPEEVRLGRWERQSRRLTVSPYYRDRMGTFAAYFAQEMEAVGDATLQQELDILRKLAGFESDTDTEAVFEGLFSWGFEVSAFEPCDRDERWWVAGDAGLFERYRSVSDGMYEPVYAEVRGRLSDPGTYGHLGQYSRELEVEEVLEIRKRRPGDCRDGGI